MKTKRTQPVDEEVGSRIRVRRLAVKMSQTDLADRIGVTFQQVQKYEKGSNRVGASRLQQIATALDVPVSYFFGSSGRADAPVYELLGFIDTALSLRLVKAFSKIKNADAQRSLVHLAEKLADK